MRFSLRETISCVFNKATGKHSSYNINIISSVLFTFILSTGFHGINSSKHGIIILSGLTSTIEETSEIIKGLGRFFDSVTTIINFISAFIDPGALILLIIVALLSTGLSFLGIQKGRFSFFVSLFIADMFWFTWIKSFYQSNELTNKIFILVKSNILLILPFVAIYFFKTQTFSKKLKPKIISILKSPFSKKKPLSFNEDDIIRITENLNLSNALLQKYITNDILNRKKKEDIILSAETLKQLKIMMETLERIKDK